MLGRQYWFPHGHWHVYPNMYIMLQGLPGVRKSTAINIGTKVLKKAGYGRFASNRMSRQMFLEELYHINQPDTDNMSFDALMDLKEDRPYEVSIHASEFLDFIGQGDKDYLMLLTSLWDNLDSYKNPKITSKSVVINKPTVNFIGGNTPAGLNMAFPPETLEGGTLSRFLFIYAASTGKKILFPSPPDPTKEEALVRRLIEIRDKIRGEATVSKEAEEVLEVIYNDQQPLEDPRLVFYFSRRLTHLLKLCLVCSAARLSTVIEAKDVLLANTMLGAAEYSMPKALGHFGRNRGSATINNMIEFIEEIGRPVLPKELYQKFMADFNRENDFINLLMDLQTSGKVFSLRTPAPEDKLLGLMVKEPEFPAWIRPLMLVDELTKDERATIGV